MPSRIVTSTSTYRYKRPPRKRKTVPLEGSAMWGKRRTAQVSLAHRRRQPDHSRRGRYNTDSSSVWK